jgi:hypothetical protein
MIDAVLSYPRRGNNAIIDMDKAPIDGIVGYRARGFWAKGAADAAGQIGA